MKTRTKVIIPVLYAITVIGLGVGAFFLVRHISTQNYQHKLEMAADCAKSYEKVIAPFVSYDFGSDQLAKDRQQQENNRTKKLEECSSKYDITQREIIDKIGTDNY